MKAKHGDEHVKFELAERRGKDREAHVGLVVVGWGWSTTMAGAPCNSLRGLSLNKKFIRA